MNGNSAEKLTQSIKKVKVLRDFDWSAKLVFDCDTTVEAAKPLVQLCLHFTDGSPDTAYEFTADELKLFITDLDRLRLQV